VSNRCVIDTHATALITLAAVLITSYSANLGASKRAYEVKMDNVSINGDKIAHSLEYKEHASLYVSCGYSYLKPHFCDSKKKERWLVSFYVDGKKMASKAGIWPAKATSLGRNSGSSTCLTKFMTSFKWTAQKGPHVMRCVLNENRQITGDKANNNLLERTIMVRKGQVVTHQNQPVTAEKSQELTLPIPAHSRLVIKSGTKKKKK